MMANESTSVLNVNDDVSSAEALYGEYVSASSRTKKLEKKVIRASHLVDHMGYKPKKVNSLTEELHLVRNYRDECLAKLKELKMEIQAA